MGVVVHITHYIKDTRMNMHSDYCLHDGVTMKKNPSKFSVDSKKTKLPFLPGELYFRF